MRLAALLGALLVAACAAPEPDQGSQPPRELAGRAAGAPQRCVLIRANDSLHVSENNRHALLYGSGPTIWLNDLGPGCGFSPNEALVTEPVGSYHCRGDFVRSFDRVTRISGASCRLGDFVPYAR